MTTFQPPKLTPAKQSSAGRESVSNNRVKSGYTNRAGAPIDMVPTAGSRSGTADGRDTTEPGIASADLTLEDGDGSPLMPPQRLMPPSRTPSPLIALSGSSRSPSPLLAHNSRSASPAARS